MTKFSEFMGEVEREAAADGPEAVAELCRHRVEFKSKRSKMAKTKPKRKPPEVITVEMAMFEVHCGADQGAQHFYVVADDSRGKAFERAMQLIFQRFSAKTSEDLPKPFNCRRVDERVLGAM